MDHHTARARRAAFIGVLFLLLLRAALSLGEVSVSFTPESPRAGEYVDVTVSADGEKIRDVRYRLSPDGKKGSWSKKAEKRLTASFRPRSEGSWTLEVKVTLSGGRTETASVTIPVSGSAPAQCGTDVIYSQMDGWWNQHLYTGTHRHTLESSGCVIFVLSHALQRLGMEGEEVLPDRLARSYGGYYTEGLGARSEALIATAGMRLGFGTAHALVTAEDEIVSFLREGSLFTLGIVPRHTVLVDGINAESRKVHITDSCPDSTFSKLGRTPTWIRAEDGTWQAVRSADEIPGVRWFFETSHCGGAGYWMDLDYCAARGLRLIRRP